MVRRRPIVSVIVPVYSEPEITIKALSNLFNQTIQNIEVIVVDDCSPLHIGELLKEKFAEEIVNERLFIVRNSTNRGASFSRNRGVRQARARYVLFADSDELFAPHHIASLASTLVHKQVACVAQHTSVYIDEHDAVIYERRYGLPGSDEFKLYLLGLTGSDILIRKDLFTQLNGFNADITYAEDWDLLRRVVQSGHSLAFNDSGTKLHREHASSITNTFDWTTHRIQHMIPTLRHSVSKRQLAVFTFGTLIWAPVRTMPLLAIKLLLADPWFFVRHWRAASFYLSNIAQQRIGRRSHAVTPGLGKQVELDEVQLAAALY